MSKFRNMMKIWRAAAVLALAFGCGGGQSMSLNLAGLPNVNPDPNGRPSPVLVKVYELKADLAFTQAEFLPLFRDPMTVLGGDLVSLNEIVLVPGEAKTLTYKPSLETRFIGVIASFRRQDQGQWRIVKPIRAEDSSIVALELSGADLRLIPDDKAKKWDPEKAVNSYRESSMPLSPMTSTQILSPVERPVPNANFPQDKAGPPVTQFNQRPDPAPPAPPQPWSYDRPQEVNRTSAAYPPPAAYQAPSLSSSPAASPPQTIAAPPPAPPAGYAPQPVVSPVPCNPVYQTPPPVAAVDSWAAQDDAEPRYWD